MIDIIVKNGHVIDPAAGIDGIANVGITGGKSLGVVADDVQATVTIDAAGHYVFPGLVDFHTHVFHKGSNLGIDPNFLIPMGVTTAADAGTAGCSNFHAFNGAVVPNSAVRLFTYLSMCSYGQPGDGFQEDFNPDKFQREKIRILCEDFPEQIKGLKIRMGAETVHEMGMEPLRRTKELAREIGCPVVVHSSNPPTPTAELLDLLDAGDVMCHCFHKKGNNTILAENDHVLPEVWAARSKGVIFDCANGHTNYNHHVAKKAIEDGFLPDIISTDMCCHTFNLDGYGKSLPYIMSKYITLGMTLNDVVKAATTTPAKCLGLENKAGTLKQGAFGDLVVCKQIKASPVYLDNFQNKLIGENMLVPVMTIKGGDILFRSPEF